MTRTEISDILYSDTNPEDKIIRSMEIQRESLNIVQLYKVTQIILRHVYPCLVLLLGLLVNTKSSLIGFGKKIETVIIITYDRMMTFNLAICELGGRPRIA